MALVQTPGCRTSSWSFPFQLIPNGCWHWLSLYTLSGNAKCQAHCLTIPVISYLALRAISFVCMILACAKFCRPFQFCFFGFVCLLVPRSGSFFYFPSLFCFLIINHSFALIPISLFDLPFAHVFKLVSQKLNKVAIIHQFRGCALGNDYLLSDFLRYFWEKPTGSVLIDNAFQLSMSFQFRLWCACDKISSVASQVFTK